MCDVWSDISQSNYTNTCENSSQMGNDLMIITFKKMSRQVENNGDLEKFSFCTILDNYRLNILQTNQRLKSLGRKIGFCQRRNISRIFRTLYSNVNFSFGILERLN